MTTKSNSFVDPSSLSLPSPMSSPSSPPSTDNVAGPSRKRQRTDMSPEERKEQRAHRNRIAAQNSRDRRKAQYSALERRVAELEEENRQLRAGVVLSDLHRSNDSQSERDRERDRENAELRERVKSLEKGWEVFIKALAAQGLSLPPVSQTSPSSSSPSSSSSVTTPTSTTTSTADSNTNSITTFPVLVPSSPVFPITPSPTISASSMCLEVDEPESTCHLARVASVPAIPPETPLQRVDSTRLTSRLLRPNTLMRQLPRLTSHRLLLGSRRQRTLMMPLWMRGSMKSSRRPRSSHRRSCLILTSKSLPYHSTRPPPAGQR